MIKFVVYGDSKPKGSVKAFTPKGWSRPILTSATKGLKDWERKIAAAAGLQADGKLLVGPVTLTIAFYMTRPKSLPKKVAHHAKRPDLDKLIRGATDALSGVVFKDDAQIFEIKATKAYTEAIDEAPRAEFTIIPVDELEFLVQPGLVGEF